MRLLGATPHLTRQLWQRFREEATYDDMGALVRSEMRQTPEEVTGLLRMLPPRRFFRWLAMLSPEGAPRDKAVMAMETAILHRSLGPDRWR
jgi:hypothetical protein